MSLARFERMRLATSGRLPRLASDFVGYGLCSAAALALDWGLLLLLYGAGVDYLVAASISFCAGLLLAYGGSTAFVFRGRRRLGRWQEAAGFVVTGLVGLLLTGVLMSLCVDVFGLDVAVAKAPTVAIVFLFNFLSRRVLLFSAAAQPL